MKIYGLGYLRFPTTAVAEWEHFCSDVLGLAKATSAPGTVRFKVDEQSYRLEFVEAPADGQPVVGWELANLCELEKAAAELEAVGRPVEVATAEEAAERRVVNMFRSSDPSGLELEFFAGTVSDHVRFSSPLGVSGFVTGDEGLGHMVLERTNFDENYDFYTGLLGFRLSDSFTRGAERLAFLHCNPRHHSVALSENVSDRMHHFMLQATSIDDVGFTLDRCIAGGYEITQSLGRHTNDKMFSFYVQTPSPVHLEFGWGGIRVDDHTWAVTEMTKGSYWGHRTRV